MAFTQTWDETVPSDSVQALTYGDALRDAARDLRERRVAFSAGPIASRETPESVWGTANRGVVYFSTDENKFYRWDGASWVEVTTILSSRLFHYFNVTPVVVTNPSGITAGVSINIPAAVMKVGSVVEFFGLIRRVSGSGAHLVGVQFGGVTITGANDIGTVAEDIITFDGLIYCLPADQQIVATRVYENGIMPISQYGVQAVVVANGTTIRTFSAFGGVPGGVVQHEFLNVSVRV